jgi:TM2 domain-containing membrane protein YozV
MREYFFLVLLVPLSAFSQSTTFDFHSQENKKMFADYLFCEGDYLRAVEEYEAIRDVIKDDTIDFKIMYCYSELGLFNKAEQNIIISPHSVLSSDFQKLYFINQFKKARYSFYYFYELGAYPFTEKETSTLNIFHKLTSMSYLYSGLNGTLKEEIIDPFGVEERGTISSFYDQKVEPPYKSAAIAGTLSAIIPGSGKMYVGEWGDGITALVVTSLFAFLAYDNFRADHTTRAWIFTGLGAFFYAGNIYGSVASAQIFNARIDFEFNDGLKLFLNQQNYFLPEYDFCK